MNKLEKIELEAKKAHEKIEAMQTLLREIEAQRSEQENLQIIQQVRALKLTRDELYTFLSGGALPASLLEHVNGAGAPEPETIFSRKEKKRRDKSNAAPPGGNAEKLDNESEGANDEV